MRASGSVHCEVRLAHCRHSARWQRLLQLLDPALPFARIGNNDHHDTIQAVDGLGYGLLCARRPEFVPSLDLEPSYLGQEQREIRRRPIELFDPNPYLVCTTPNRFDVLS
jgi:hypothetical protein